MQDTKKELFVFVSLFAMMSALVFLAGCADLGLPDIPSSQSGNLNMKVLDTNNASLEGASILLIGYNASYKGITDESGKYSFNEIPAGTYTAIVVKPGYRDNSGDITINPGSTHTWTFTIARDCLYYSVNASTNYVVRYGYNGTMYKGYGTYVVAYPEGATYSIFPAVDGSLSQLSTTYKAGNRMLTWRLDNIGGRYSYVQGNIFIDLKGTGTMNLFTNMGTSISEASSGQPGYLANEFADDSYDDTRMMINPFHPEIKAIAEQVRQETGSNDTWTVAKALFIWLKSNTEYYHGPESDQYTQSAAEVLHSGKGDCDELSFLYISLCRAIGIPARFVEGYMAENNPDLYISHMWVEFYDGKWVPVEVATSGKVNVTNAAVNNFGITLPNHIPIFVDDGTGASISKKNRGALGGEYYDRPNTVSSYTFYDAIDYDPMYIAVCSDGAQTTRTLVKEKD